MVELLMGVELKIVERSNHHACFFHLTSKGKPFSISVNNKTVSLHILCKPCFNSLKNKAVMKKKI